jgi:type IV secretory pathway VirB10-like protein
MRAYRFKRSPAPAFQWLRKAGLLTAKTFVCLGLLSACQTKKESQTPTETAITGVSTAGSSVRQVVARAPKPTVPSARQEQPGSVLPPQPQPLSTQVGERLRSSFEVADIDGESIRVRKSTAETAAPSLFEEAIILGKLRSFLKLAAAPANQTVTFHNGTAAVSFSPKINSGTASVLIAKMLSLDGVNEVCAGFSD